MLSAALDSSLGHGPDLQAGIELVRAGAGDPTTRWRTSCRTRFWRWGVRLTTVQNCFSLSPAVSESPANMGFSSTYILQCPSPSPTIHIRNVGRNVGRRRAGEADRAADCAGC